MGLGMIPLKYWVEFGHASNQVLAAARQHERRDADVSKA
jgi:hypothetical protein